MDTFPQEDCAPLAGATASNRLHRDTRLDALVAQSRELAQGAAIINQRVFEILQRLDGPRPQVQGGRLDEKVPHQPGYIAELGNSLDEIRDNLSQAHEVLNELDGMV